MCPKSLAASETTSSGLVTIGAAWPSPLQKAQERGATQLHTPQFTKLLEAQFPGFKLAKLMISLLISDGSFKDTVRSSNSFLTF